MSDQKSVMSFNSQDSIPISEAAIEEPDKLTYAELVERVEGLHHSYNLTACGVLKRGHGKHTDCYGK